VLLRTRNSRLWHPARPFTTEFVYLAADGADWLLERGVRLVGIDYLSIGDPDAHHVFLGNGIVPLEGVNLTDVESGPYRLVCTALKIEGSDGAPARALLFDSTPGRAANKVS